MPSPSLSIPDLAGKAVLVTGASTGIGAALARAYAEQGCKVGLHYNQSREAAEKLAAEIAKQGRRGVPDPGRLLGFGRRRRASSRTRPSISAGSTGWSTMPAACSAASPIRR